MARQEPPVVRFEFDADEVQFPRFLRMAENFLAVLHEVDHDMAPGAGVQWVVETISKSSPLVLALRPAFSNPKAAPTAVRRRLVKTVNDGIRTVQRKAVRPPHFTD